MLNKRSAAEDREYFLKRSADHRELADLAENSANQALHRRFSDMYLTQAEKFLVVEDN